MSCPTIFTGDTVTLTGVAPEGSASDSITLPIPDWPTSRKTKSSTKIIESLDGNTLVFGGDDYLTREVVENRELIFNLNYTQKEQFYNFLQNYIGKRVTVTGFIETVGTVFVITNPMIDIEETLRTCFLEMANPKSNYAAGDSEIDITKLATFTDLKKMIDLRVRFYSTGIPLRDYTVNSLVNSDSTTDVLGFYPALDDGITTSTRVVILNKCPLYRVKINLLRTSEL